MKLILNLGILLLTLSAVLAAMGALLVEKKKMAKVGGRRYSKIAALLVAGAAFWMVQNSKVFAGISDLNLAALVAAIWVIAYFLVWGVMVFQLNRLAHVRDHDHSSMLSMLYVDSSHHHDVSPPAEPANLKSDSKSPTTDKKSWSD